MLHSAKVLRRAPTRSEVLLWEQLRDRRFQRLKFRRQHAIGRLILDMYCPELQLAIEVDGRVHDTPEARRNDAERDALLEQERGIRTLRVTAHDCESDMASVLLRLAEATRATQNSLPLSIRDGEGAGG